MGRKKHNSCKMMFLFWNMQNTIHASAILKNRFHVTADKPKDVLAINFRYMFQNALQCKDNKKFSKISTNLYKKQIQITSFQGDML